MLNYEADDLIATYTRQILEKGDKVTIVSSDKDLMQLLKSGVRIYDPMKSKVIGLNEVKDKFGVNPNKVIDVQALAGDSSDNVPGVPGRPQPVGWKLPPRKTGGGNVSYTQSCRSYPGC